MTQLSQEVQIPQDISEDIPVSIERANHFELEYHDGQCLLTVNNVSYVLREFHILSTCHSGSEVRIRICTSKPDASIIVWQDITVKLDSLYSYLKVK